MNMLTIRPAGPQDLDYLVETDLLNEGYTPAPGETPMTDAERADHRTKIAGFINDPCQGGWIAEDSTTGAKAGMILARFRDRQTEPDDEANRFLFQFIDNSIFPPDGKFCEVFQLWVHPTYRRQGLATRLKQVLEDEAKKRGIHMIYTHTEAQNEHVIEMNRKLGYREVRRGPLWDDVIRVSLVKWLDGE